jgi:hypothetical protein
VVLMRVAIRLGNRAAQLLHRPCGVERNMLFIDFLTLAAQMFPTVRFVDAQRIRIAPVLSPE